MTGMWLDRVEPWQIAGLVYLSMSVVTFAVYGWDKSAASRGRRRVPEPTLHLLELLGGWPGALLAMQVFKHKRRKWRFAIVVWLIAAGHLVGWYFVRGAWFE